jgi:serine/threonine-protein kinase
MIKKLLFLELSALGMTLFSTVANAIPVSNANINFAGAGGDSTSRTATFVVPDKNTTKLVKDGLRLYEVHLAKMIEVTNDFCKDRDSKYVVYWNYEVEDGKIFMGQYALTCQFAKNTFQKFGSSTTENVTVNHRGDPTTVKVSVLNLNSKNAKEFATLVQSIKPGCIEANPKICPGDRLE